jgi:flagellar motor switch protein FliM
VTDSLAPNGEGLGAIAVRRLDLTGRERHLRSAVQAMERVAGAFARAARRSMPFLVRYRSHVVPGPVEVLSGVEADQVGAPPYVSLALSSADGLAKGMVGLNAEAIGLVLEGALGGRGPFWKSPMGAELSPVQRALVMRIAGSLAADLATTVKSEVGIDMVMSPAAPQAPSGERASGDMLRVICAIEGLPVPAAIAIAVSAQAVESAARQAADEPPPQGDPRVGEALREIEVNVVAELGRVSLGLERVLSLQPGDVLRLSTAMDDSIAVRVAGVHKLDAVPLVSRGQLAIEIKARHEG